MALTDFLFNGSPPASTTTYGSSTSSLPAWYNDYTQGLISKANALAAGTMNFTPGAGQTAADNPFIYQGQRVADTTANQTNAWDNVANQASMYQTGPNGEPPAAFSPAQTNIAGAANTAFSTAPGQQAQSLYNQAQTVGNQGYGNANTAINVATGTTAGNIGTNAYDGVQKYLNPYTNAVVDQVGRTGSESLSNNLANLADKYIGGGGYGGSRMGAGLGAAARAGTRDILGQQSSLLNQGYTQALGAQQTDLNRQLQGAGQLGSLGTAQGNLASTQQQGLGALGQQLAGVGQSDLARQLQAGTAQGNLAQTIAQTGTSQNAALEAAGQSQQQQNQRNLDAAQQKFTQGQQLPYDQISFLNNAIRGLQIPTSQQTSQTGPASVYQASPLSQLAAAGTGLAGLAKLG